MKLPVPSDWDGESYALMLVCIPDSVQWKAIVRGAIYGLTWWKSWDNQTGDTYTVRDIANEIYESIMVCKLDDLVSEFKRLNAILSGEQITLDIDGTPTTFDYSETGISPRLTHLSGINSNTANLTHLGGIDSDLDALAALAGINTDLDALANLGQLPAMLAQLVNLAADTDALASLANLSQLANINTNLENLTRLGDINTALGQLSELAALTDLAADTDALGNLGNLSNLLTIAGSIADLTTQAGTANGHAANIAAELGDINTDLDFLNQLETVGVELSELSQRFRTHNSFYPDQDIADVFANTLYGRYIGFPIPGDGVGITDLINEVKEELQVLHNRFLMADSSIFNPFGDKNIVEALETLLRRDSISDVEGLPNVATILERSLNMGSVDTVFVDSIKAVLRRMSLQGLFPQSLSDWLAGKIDEEGHLSAADLLFILARANEFQYMAQRGIEEAIEDSQLQININNTANCNGTNGTTPTNGSPNGQIVLTEEGINVQIEEPEKPPLLGDGD